MTINKKISPFLILIISLFVGFFVFCVVSPKQAYAESCYGFCTVDHCSSDACGNCCFCPGKGPCPTSRPPESPDDIEGKIVNPVLPTNLSTLKGTAFLSKLLRTGISLMFVFGSIIFLFILTSGGVKWLSSSGDKVKLESAQKQITSGLTGLAILLTTFVIIQLVQTIFGVDLLNITLPTL